MVILRAAGDYVAVVGSGNLHVRVSSVVKPKLSLLYEVRGRLHMAAFFMPLLLVAESERRTIAIIVAPTRSWQNSNGDLGGLSPS